MAASNGYNKLNCYCLGPFWIGLNLLRLLLSLIIWYVENESLGAFVGKALPRMMVSELACGVLLTDVVHSISAVAFHLLRPKEKTKISP